MTIIHPLMPFSNIGITSSDDGAVVALCRQPSVTEVLYEDTTVACDEVLDGRVLLSRMYAPWT